MQKRDTSDVWAGLYDFPLIENQVELTDEEIRSSILKKYNKSIGEMKTIHSAKKHQLSHQTIFAHFIEIRKDELPLKNNEINKKT